MAALAGIKIILTIALIIGSAWYDASEIKKGNYFKDHTSRFLLRGFCALIISGGVIAHVFGVAFLFFGIFNPLLNRLRGLGFWYLGTEAKTDVFFSKYPMLYKFCIISSFFLGVWLFI